jgi:hypothetical protein
MKQSPTLAMLELRMWVGGRKHRERIEFLDGGFGFFRRKRKTISAFSFRGFVRALVRVGPSGKWRNWILGGRRGFSEELSQPLLKN